MILPGFFRRRASGSSLTSPQCCVCSLRRSCWSFNVAEIGRMPAPLGMLAELTHRCPLGCPYCSNPVALERRDDELDAATWARVFREAAGLGVLQVHLSGGEPGARRDLVALMGAAHAGG